MKSLRALPLILLLASLTSDIGCSTSSDIALNADDIATLNKIYETSPWSVRNSKLDLKAREGGAIDVTLEGAASHDGNASGPIWFPLAMMSELPDYFEGTDVTTNKTIELEAYRVPDGLWCLTVVLPGPEPTASVPNQASLPSPTPTPEPMEVAPTASPAPKISIAPAVDVKVRVTMVSKQFLSGFPILIPSGEGHGAVTTTVSVPRDARFSTLNVTSGDRADQSSMLAPLPLSITDNDQKAAARLMPMSGIAWNFANVTYETSAGDRWRPWFIPSATLISVLAFFLWWQFEKVAPAAKSLLRLRRIQERSLEELHRQKHGLITSIRRESFSSELNDALSRTIWALTHLPETGRIHEKHVRLWDEEVAQPVSSLPSTHDKDLLTIRLKVERVSNLLKELQLLNERLEYPRARELRRVSMILWVLLVASVIWLLASVARAQPQLQQARNKPSVIRLATLAELSVEVAPQLPTSANHDKVNVSLTFFPLSDVGGKPNLEEIGFGVSDAAHLSIDPVQLPPNSPAKIIQETGKLVRLNVPVSLAPAIQRWKVFADWKPVEFSAPPEYLRSLDAANKVSLTYTIKGAQVVKERTNGRFFHWFPFESAEVQLPFDLRQSAIVSQINLLPPTSEYVANPFLEGRKDSFVESESGRSYQLAIKEKDGRSAILANNPVILKASFQRPWWQRYGLLGGQLLLGAIGGLLFGWILFLGDSNWITKIIAGIGVLGLPFAIRTAAFAKYDNLPSLLLFQGITLFEVFFLANILLMLIVTIIFYKRLQRS